MKKLYQILILSILISMIASKSIYSQSKLLRGVVKELVVENGVEKYEALINVNIYWLGTTIGTVSDENGKFEIKKLSKTNNKLVISYIGYQTDTIEIKANQNEIEIFLSVNNQLKSIEILERRQTSFISKIEPIQTQLIMGEELMKAACCNLSESFETNASVDVAYSDAVTGAKQIKLLGLDGKYSQIMSEKIPFIRGLSSMFGLGYIPGSWMESIQVSKGTASVENGFESITGQINVEYKKPDNGEWLYLNALTSDKGKIEGNFNARLQLSETWSTMILAHAEQNNSKHDFNNDLFLDQPTIEQINFINRWKYKSDNGFITQFGIKYIDEKRLGGQVSFNEDLNRDTNNGYGIGIDTKYIEVFHKAGLVFSRPKTSLALIQSYSLYNQNSYYGFKDYEGEQNSYYFNLLFHSYLFNTFHKYKTGLSFVYDNFDESLFSEILNIDTVFLREESIPGAYFEYTYAMPEKFTFMAGLRYDYHNIFGGFFTPRFHIKYNLFQNTIVRSSLGKGYRTPNIFAENSYLLASSRKISIVEDILQEEAWNYGFSLNQTFNIKQKEVSVNLEFYRTDFKNQLIVDVDKDISHVYFYNLNGESYSNSGQIEILFEPIERLDFLAAFRLTDVKTTINNQLISKPLVNKYKGLLTLSYKTELKKWQFDYTLQINGDGRLPNTESLPEENQISSDFPAYSIMNAQITKYFEVWNIYVGVENITDFTQKNPIIAADNPFGEYFDSSLAWGPLIGRKFYVGLRFSIDK